MQGVLVGSLAMRVGWTEERDEQGLEKSRSRGGLWVMLRDETPRGFIEERRGEKEERGRGGEEKRRKKEEECRSWLCSNSKEHSRRTLSLSLSPRFFSFPFFVSLSFSLFQSCETGALQRDEKSGRPPVESCHGDEKRIFFVLSSPFFHRLLPPFGFSLPSTSLRAFFSSTLPSPLSFRRRWNHSENDSTRFRGTFVWRAFNARALHRGTPNVLMLPQKKLYGGEKPCIWFPSYCTRGNHSHQDYNTRS